MGSAQRWERPDVTGLLTKGLNKIFGADTLARSDGDARKDPELARLRDEGIKAQEALRLSQEALAQSHADLAQLREEWIKVHEAFRLSQEALAQSHARFTRLQDNWIEAHEAFRRSQEVLAEKDALLDQLRSEAIQPNSQATPGEFDATAQQLTPYKGRLYSDFSELEKSIYLKSALNLCGGPEAIATLIRAVEYVARNGIAGAFVECGVFMGGNIEVMIRALQNLQIDDRDIYLYDTFAGMPQPEARDDEGLDGAIKASWEAHRTDADGTSGSDWMRATVETVRQRIEPLGYPTERLHFVKGMVEDTIPGIAPEKIAILRLDTDFYSSTKHELIHLYPRLMPGGILIIDDYGAIPGARIAADEYASENDLGWFLHRVDPHVRLAVKPKTS
jgi:O-methyltransferase